MFSRFREMIHQRRERDKLYSTEAYWNSKAATYKNTAVSMWLNESLNRLYEEEQFSFVQNHVDSILGRSVLDLGCGTGRFSRWFAQNGAQVSGIDFSSGSLDIARKLSSGDNPSYQHGSVFELSDENIYDVVLVSGVLTVACRDADELKDALLRIRRSIRPDGCLLLLEPIHRGFLHRVLDLDIDEFLLIMRQAGFDIEKTKPLLFWPARLALSYVPWPAWLTVPCYHVGQALMKLPGLTKLGDYWAIVARPLPQNP